jgi:hypothetical protein
VVDLFKLYTFDFGHIFIRAIVWKKILLYSVLLELLQNLRTGPRLLPPASPSLFLCRRCPPPITGISPSHQLPSRPSSCATWTPAPPHADASRRCPPETPRAPSTVSSCLLPTHAPFFLLWNVPSELLPSSIPSRAPAFLFYFLLRLTTSPELLCPPPSAASTAPPLQFHAPLAPPHLIAPS